MTAARLSAIAILIACNGTTNTSVGVEPRAVGGAAIQHNVADNGAVNQSRDLSPVDGVRTFLVDNPQSPSLDIYHFGRGDALRPVLDTNVTFNVSGLSGWDANASLQVVSSNVGMTMSGLESELSIAPGASAIVGQTLNWKNARAPLVDAAKGDAVLVTQLVGMTSDGRSYSALARAGAARGFSMTDGQPARLDAELTSVALDRSVAVRWRGSQFAALASQVGPGARPAAAATLAIAALPDAVARHNDFFATYYTGLPSVVVFPPLAGVDFDQTIAYGNPFTSMGSAWTELVTVAYACAVPIPTESGTGSLPARLIAAVPVASLSNTDVIAPSISPVQAASINGMTLDVPRAGVGESPTITWEAPSLGVATDYVVRVHAVDASSEGVSVKTIAALHTKSTSLRIPGSVITAGTSYVLTITAVAARGADLSTQPFIGGLPYASADYVTARLTP